MLETIGSMDRVRTTIHQTVAEVMAQRGLDPAEIADDAKLSDTLGLKSMDLAQIVLTLEDDLETDPFQSIPITSIRTVGDLVTAYGVSLGLIDQTAPGAQDMGAEMAAARARRAGRRR